MEDSNVGFADGSYDDVFPVLRRSCASRGKPIHILFESTFSALFWVQSASKKQDLDALQIAAQFTEIVKVHTLRR
jgi:hypothetical protein